MSLQSRLIVGGIAAGAALAYYVHRRRARTGEGYIDILKQLPSDAQRWAGDARLRATRALEEGRTAAREHEAAIAGQLEAAGEAATPGAGG